MSSAEPPSFQEESEDANLERKEAPAPARDPLASFAVLADPNEIAGEAPAAAGEQQAIVDRLRAELQRRARQVERMSANLNASKAGPATNPPGASEEDAKWKSPGASDEAGLKRLLHAAHRARHDLQERLNARQQEFDELTREKKALSTALEQARAELTKTAGERERVSELMSNLTTRSAAYERLSDECDSLRRGLVEAQREAAEARKASERGREVLNETRGRVAEREAEASALRAALAANQKQAQARECDNEELKAALNIASETLEARRAELRQARAELESTTRRLSESEIKASQLENELQAQHERTSAQTGELAKLKETVPRLQGELEARSREADTLRERLTAQQNDLVDAREALSQTRIRCERLGDELETEREAHKRARDRATEREATVARLHETLSSIGKAASVFPLTRTTGSEAPPAAAAPSETASTVEPKALETQAKTEPSPAVPEEQASPAPQAPAVEAASVAPRKPDDAETIYAFAQPSPNPERPAIFTAWRDQQIRRKLATLDVTSSDDYFARHVAEAAAAADGARIDVLSLGGEDSEFELRIARALRQRGDLDFRLHFPMRDGAHAARMTRKAAGAGLDSELVAYDAASWTEARLPETLHAIVGDGALARTPQAEPFADALLRAARSGCQIALAERIGGGESRAAREMGERIWRLMPERYKTNHVTGLVEEEFASQVFTTPDFDVLALLRSRFAFEDFASFGHLVDRFIGPEIGPNFDPEDDRDLRFIDQIANLDEAKLDSGALAPLHMIVRLAARDAD